MSKELDLRNCCVETIVVVTGVGNGESERSGEEWPCIEFADVLFRGRGREVAGGEDS